jgi:hypothetical protein
VPRQLTEKRRAQNREAQRRFRQSTRAKQLAEAVKETGELPEAPDYETLLRLLGVQAMNGHVPAIRLLLEEYRRNGNGDEGRTLDQFLDEFAEREYDPRRGR